MRTLSFTREAKRAPKLLGSNPRRSWCIERVMDTFTLGRPHAYGPAALVLRSGRM